MRKHIPHFISAFNENNNSNDDKCCTFIAPDFQHSGRRKKERNRQGGGSDLYHANPSRFRCSRILISGWIMVNAENCACLFIGQRFFAGISNERRLEIIGIGNRDDDFFRRKEETDFF